MPRIEVPSFAIIEKATRNVRNKSSGLPFDRDYAITINFHPDALYGSELVIEALARDGVYRSQFETGISNGAMFAHPDCGRLLWESRIFGGAYDSAEATDRPKYGALNHQRLTIGGSPRFGSAHFRLRPEVLDRATFCYPDSHLDPQNFGVAEKMGLLEAVQPADDPLDDYVEAQIHGLIDLSDDVSAIVLDPSFRGTVIEKFAHNLECPVEWHPGFSMPASKLPFCEAYRDERIAELAASLFNGPNLTPACIAKARRGGPADLHDLKRVWHCVARFGSPVSFRFP
ncbi:uncharacterized protein DUF3626 [Limimaricola soesokkakensis]|uniref:Uncharacterized protein DUF3626 n=1 Tax=Limimaricola soesokkakensis TaxID=1343159 RepID=A0A1X7A6Q3_9RHOB|nr:DUF3626 domain-containing protein [Limimaricola soesokkakensis]PSK80275.1 uncharacterized protein DUF3626 [Limimaricola soesokkakensis]SLN72037.1 hypothetical protein LOS8367_03659 [Limimaricola soesokkakensis]